MEIKESGMPSREENFDFSSFNDSVDMKGLMTDLANAESGNSGDFPEVPHGDYEVGIDRMTLAVSKGGNPMLKVQMRIKGGRYNKACLFYNQVVTNGYGLHSALTFLRSLDVMKDDEVKFTGDFNALRDLISKIKEKVDEQNLTFALTYGTTDKGFDTYSIVEVFEN